MSAKISMTCAVAACVGLAASVALADGNGDGEPSVANPYGQIDVAPGDFYVGAAGGVQWMTLPDWEYGVEDSTADSLKSLFEIEGDGWLYGGQVWLGLGVDAGPGEHTRIQLEGSYAEGDFVDRQSRPAFDGAAAVLLDASDSESIGELSEATLEVDVRGWEAGLRALTDARSDTSGAFTPSLMVFGGAASQDYDANTLSQLPSPPFFEDFVRQDVDTWYVGLEAAFAATVNLSQALTLTLGGRVAGLYFDADMDGEDCIDSTGGQGTPGCQVGSVSEVSDDLDAVTYRGGGFVALAYDFGGASVGIMGTADYVPMADIVNPRSTVGEGGTPSHLDLSHELVYGGRGSIVIPFN